ncbi:ribonuclease H-like domain-containing protein [Tanacetum coccineum]
MRIPHHQPPPAHKQTPTQQTPHTVSTIKLPILKKGEYDIWAMKMEHYLAHTDYPIWEVIQNGNGPVSVTTDTTGQLKILPPKTAEERFTVSNTDGIHKGDREYKDFSSQYRDPEQVWLYDLHEKQRSFQQETGRKLQFDAKEPVGFDKTKVECYNCHKTGHFARECRTKEDNRRRDGWNSGNKDGNRTGKKEESKALVTVDGESVDWTTHSEDDENFAFMASNSSGSDTQVNSCSNECKESYTNLKRLYDAQREQLSDASVEIKAYTQGLKKVEAQLVAHQQGQLWYEQKIKFMKIDLDDKTDVLTYHKKLLAKAQKEKDDLEVIVDKWNHSSKNLGKIVNYPMSASDKFGLGYGDYRYSGILSYENEVFQSVFKGNKSDFENLPLHKRLGKTSEMQAVPPPMTGNYLPSGPDVEIDDSQYTYGPQKTQPIVNESTKRSYNLRENVKNQSTHSQKPKVNNKELGQRFTERACFGNKATLLTFKILYWCPLPLRYVKGYITGKGKIKTGKLDFEDVSFVKELQPFNLFSVSQICDKKNKVLFTDTECLVLCPDFKLPDENQILLKVPRQNNMYSFNLENIVPLGDAENQARHSAGQQESTTNRHKRTRSIAGDSEKEDEISAQDCFELPIWHSYSSTNPFASKSEIRYEQELLVSTASANEGLSLSDTTNTQKDDSEIPLLEDIHEDTTDGIFTHSSYDEEPDIMFAVCACSRFQVTPKTSHLSAVKRIFRKSWLLFKSKKIAQVVSAWIKSKNSLVKHFEDMRLCRPSKEYLQVWFNPPRDESMSCLTTKGMHTIGEVCTRNVSFHEVIDFLRRSHIYHALTVSPVVSTTFVEQFWTSAKSKTINNVRHITAKIAGKVVSISEASIRTDLIFDDADGIELHYQNQTIF